MRPIRGFFHALPGLVLVVLAAVSPGVLGQGLPRDAGAARVESRAAAGLDQARLGRIADLVEADVAAGELPGAVVVAGRAGQVSYRQAFGSRAIDPQREPMTPDTIFDLASLTKVVATAPSVMLLVEEGRLRLSDRVADFLPGFERYGKGEITVRHLLTHMSGLRPDLDLVEPWVGYDEAIARAIEEAPVAYPDERFIYSDINFFLLGDLVARLSGMPLDEFARVRIFDPLGMHETTFKPPASWSDRIAPTETCTPYGWPCEGAGAEMLRGVVHDPTARRMGGVAGHAGLFSTADDLARFCQMLLGGGELQGRRVLSPLTVNRMTSAATPPDEPNVRGLGWDVDSVYSANRGDLFPLGSFGHTGFTGTSLWLDPVSQTFVVFLSNRLHPDGRGNVTPLRAKVSTVVAGAVADLDRASLLTIREREAGRRLARLGSEGTAEPVLAGIDVLEAERFERLRGRRVGLVTNQSGRSRSGESTIDLLAAAEGVELVALFSPEHGIRGELEGDVAGSRDESTGLPIHSLYGATRRPTEEMLRGIDTLVVDLQDVGARFYTYATTMAYVLEEAAAGGLRVVVLDRPNPINGAQIEGPMLDAGALGFTGYHPMPVRHGLTMGELARLFDGEKGLGVDLEVVEMRGWRRSYWFDETGLPWINPSPNMRNLIQATLYPGIGAFEGTNISVGRGTDSPFEQIGAPWIDGVRLAAELNARGLPGIRFYPTRFTPRASKYASELCEGVFMIVTDRAVLRPVRVGVEIAAVLRRLHGRAFELEKAATLLGSAETLTRLMRADDPAAIAAGWAAAEADWRERRGRYLLYR